MNVFTGEMSFIRIFTINTSSLWKHLRDEDNKGVIESRKAKKDRQSSGQRENKTMDKKTNSGRHKTT